MMAQDRISFWKTFWKPMRKNNSNMSFSMEKIIKTKILWIKKQIEKDLSTRMDQTLSSIERTRNFYPLSLIRQVIQM